MSGELTLQQRCDSYAETFPDWPPPRVENGRISGIWMLGNNYRSRSDLYGAYPPGYLNRVRALFPDLIGKMVMHLFSGSLPPGPYTRVDLVRDADIQADAQHLPEEWDNLFDLIIADPPYSREDAKRYECPMPNRRLVLQECARVIRPGGFVVWLDTVWPMCKCGQDNPNADWNLAGHIGVIRSMMHRVRVVTLLERR